MSFYDGTKLLSLYDINGLKPEIYISESNRSAGKTTYVNKMVVNRYIKKQNKFGILYRYNYELDGVADKFFKDVKKLFFKNMDMESKRQANGIYHEMYLDGESCGYAISLNSSDQIKKYSHLLSDTTSLIFDEFQSETNHYCNDEVTKFISIHTSIARGNGEHVRYLPVYMIGNPVSLINPYYTTLGISARLKNDTKFLRGDGWVLESGFNETASQAQKQSAFNKAFKDNKYVAYSTQSIYLNDSKAFIEKPVGAGKYLATLKAGQKTYGIREYADQGIIYIDDKADNTYKLRITISTEDHDVNYVMLKKNDLFLGTLRYFFEHGCLRFKDLKCKEIAMKAISY